MIETKIGGIETTTVTTNTDPYIIALFADENGGKTRFCMTSKELIGCAPLEIKAYKTIDKDSREFGKKVITPKNPMDLIVSIREVSVKTDIDQQKFYIDRIKRVEDYIYALLTHKDVQTVMIDKFTTMCQWYEYAVNGMQEKFIKVDGKVYKDRHQLNQTIIDFLNSLSQFKKTIVLTNASKDDYDVLGTDKKPFRKTWDSFKYLGSHVNLVCEMVDNKHWNAAKADDVRYNWHYGLSIRRCQDNPMLEGPDGQLVLKDEQISLANLIMTVNPNADIERYM